MAVADGLVVATEQPHDPMEVQGANDRRNCRSWSVITSCALAAA
jgi:hypothetical protein